MDSLKILQSRNILKNANSYILTNREKRELIDSFNSLSNLSDLSKNLTLKEMINLFSTNKKMKAMIEKKKKELESYKLWLSKLPNPQNYTIEELDKETKLYLYDNNITNIPNFNLPKLQLLDLSDNKLKKIPMLILLPNLQILNLTDNPLSKTEKDRLRSIYGDKVIVN